MISDNKINIIIDRTNNSPRFYQLNKRTLKFLFLGIPVTTIFIIICSYFFASYFKALYEDIKENEPVMVRKLKSEIEDLKKQNTALVDNESKLLEKIEKGSSFTSVGINQLVQTPLGMDNKVGHKLCTIEDIEIKDNQLFFKIANQIEDKLRGYFFLFHYHGNTVEVYPTGEFKDSQLNYRDGDSFLISRFKPMQIKFPKIYENSTFYSVIFSNSGDLIFSQKIEVK